MENKISKSAPNNSRSLVRKPSYKNRKPPEVKLNATTKYRMLKANPFLNFEQLDVLPPSSFSIPDILSDLSGKPSLIKNDTKNIEIFDLPKPTSNNTTTNKPKSNNEKKKTMVGLARSQSLRNDCKSVNNTYKVPASKDQNKAPQKACDTMRKGKEIVNTFKKPLVKAAKSTNIGTTSTIKDQPKTNKQKKIEPLRRSLSAQHFDRKKGKSQNPEVCIMRSESTQSLDDVKVKKISHVQPDLPNLKENSFNTPSAYKRRSVAFFTPTSSVKTFYTPVSSTPSIVSKDLKTKLDNWLKKRGKSVASFHHLKCFGLHNKMPSTRYAVSQIDFDEENKENIDVIEDLGNGSYEDLGIINEESENNSASKSVPVQNLQEIARDALSDLHKLILEGYPRDQCESWLGLIRQKYRKLEVEPTYWECRAAIEQERGNITSAVEYYKNAIIQGADEKLVDESLDQLLQKFSLLDINTVKKEESKNDRARVVVEVRNIFKSSIIQFAVQERVKKMNDKGDKEQKQYLVTPVRRSTRSRRSAAYTSTPGTKLCSSLMEIETSIKETMEFHSNNALC